MNVSAAVVSTLVQHTITFVDKARKIDLEGFAVNDDDETVTFKAGIVPEDAKTKKGDQDGSYAVDDNSLFVCGRLDVKPDDLLSFCEITKAKVLKMTYWREAGFTHIVTRTLTRREVSYA